MPLCKKNDTYETYLSSFEGLASKWGMDMETPEGRHHFGKAASYFVNSERCGDKMTKGEQIRYYLLQFIRVVIIGFLLFSTIFNFIPIDDESYNTVNEIKEFFDEISNLVIGITLIVMFWPRAPSAIHTPTDLLFAFIAGTLLTINGVTNLVKSLKNKT